MSSTILKKKRRKFSHRLRVTLRSTAVSSVILLGLLLLFTAYLQKGTENFLNASLHHSMELTQSEIEQKHLGSNNLPKVRSPLVTIGSYDPNGTLLYQGGKSALPQRLSDFRPPDGSGFLTDKQEDGTTLLVMLDYSDRLSDLKHTKAVFLLLWPTLTLLIGVATFFSVSSTFVPLGKLLDQARHLQVNDRLETPDQAEFGELADNINSYLDTIQRVVSRQEEFAVDAAHELCTPLTALRGSLEVALRKKDDRASLSQAAKKAVEQVDRLQRLVEGLLLAARPYQGAVTSCQAEEVVEEVLSRWIDQFAARDVYFEVDTVPFQAAIRGEELEAVVTNLLANAFKFAPAQSTVSVHLDKNGILTVQDEGPGIPDEKREVIFQRFERGDSKSGGHGIGLYLVKKLIEQRNGTVQAMPSSHGALIQVTLPRVVEEEAVEPSLTA